MPISQYTYKKKEDKNTFILYYTLVSEKFQTFDACMCSRKTTFDSLSDLRFTTILNRLVSLSWKTSGRCVAFSIDGVRHLDGGRLPACARTRRKLGVSGGDEGGTSKSATCMGHAIDVLEKGNGFGLITSLLG